jgi:hypothetical protein
MGAEHGATLQLDEAIGVPRYQSELDNHCTPGSYYAEYIEGDVAAAANYDAGTSATTTGLFGRFLDAAGAARARAVGDPAARVDAASHPRPWLRRGAQHAAVLPALIRRPRSWPSILPAPMLRYGHARRRSDLACRA